MLALLIALYHICLNSERKIADFWSTQFLKVNEKFKIRYIVYVSIAL
jgi:hypothetical protein